ncbi:hypothetical protein Psta_3144 [Pirellula staleyi DSM 6068]|uniref:Uncharacterized protein n=1 Tax=Pirellula staleyi (strain ATCC 27377 / DSM 6068 / ICPB 4128) TaxID=530564 RepID=D2QWK5_PIRSD|nr:hypothetical protein Psta_3144 [Pirellula staleyi DSM 6068]
MKLANSLQRQQLKHDFRGFDGLYGTHNFRKTFKCGVITGP